MITPKQIAARFHAMLAEKEQGYGRGFNKHLHHKTNLSTGYLSEILNGAKDGSQAAQIKICDAVGVDYHKMIQGENGAQQERPSPRQLHPLHMHQIIAALVEIEQLDPAAYGTIADLITLCQQKIKKRPQSTGTA